MASATAANWLAVPASKTMYWKLVPPGSLINGNNSCVNSARWELPLIVRILFPSVDPSVPFRVTVSEVDVGAVLTRAKATSSPVSTLRTRGITNFAMLLGLTGMPIRDRRAFVAAARWSRYITIFTGASVTILAQAMVPIEGVVPAVVPPLITSTLFGSSVSEVNIPLLIVGTVEELVMKVRFVSDPSSLRKFADTFAEITLLLMISMTMEYFVAPPSKLPIAIWGIIFVNVPV